MTKPPPDAAWSPPPYHDAEHIAIHALARGEADPHQQKLALDWIIERACATYDQSYRPESERETVFAEGRRFVGLQVVKLTNFKPKPKRTKDGRRTERSNREQPG